MAVKGELEGLIHNHNSLISRGSITEAAKIKDLISGYLSQKEMKPRLYRAIRDKFEEFLFCAETNFDRFHEIINYEHLTQLEFFYPEFFTELGDEINNSANKMIEAGVPLYSGLLLSSSIHGSRKLLTRIIQNFLQKGKFEEIESVFDRLEETRLMKMQMVSEDAPVKDFPLINDEESAQAIGSVLYDIYSEEAEKLEKLENNYSAASAYRLGNILTAYFDDLDLIKDAEMASTATLYLKEVVARTNGDNIERLIGFLQRFRKNPAIKRYADANPEIFGSYINSPDVRDGLVELVRNMLGKTQFDEAEKLARTLEGMMTFQPIFRDHLSTLKQNGFFVQAIEMAEKLQMREEITDDLKLEAFGKLLDDVRKNPVKSSVQRLKKFCAKQRINSENYSVIDEMVSHKIDGIEKVNPEIAFDLESLYRLLKIEMKKHRGGEFNPARLFEPIIWFFAMIFRGFIKLAGILTGGFGKPGGGTGNGKGKKAAATNR